MILEQKGMLRCGLDREGKRRGEGLGGVVREKGGGEGNWMYVCCRVSKIHNAKIPKQQKRNVT